MSMVRMQGASLVLIVVLGTVFCPAVVLGSRVLKTGFVVKGKVFCDTCRAGFETPATTFVAGATVKLECRDRASGKMMYAVQGVTDATGAYHLLVANDHEDQICESMLVSSPDARCAEAIPGRDRARVVLTYNNGIPSSTRLANNIGFMKMSATEGCSEVMKMYQTDEEDHFSNLYNNAEIKKQHL